jgi:hypothetical protein
MRLRTLPTQSVVESNVAQDPPTECHVAALEHMDILRRAATGVMAARESSEPLDAPDPATATFLNKALPVPAEVSTADTCDARIALQHGLDSNQPILMRRSVIVCKGHNVTRCVVQAGLHRGKNAWASHADCTNTRKPRISNGQSRGDVIIAVYDDDFVRTPLLASEGAKAALELRRPPIARDHHR